MKLYSGKAASKPANHEDDCLIVITVLGRNGCDFISCNVQMFPTSIQTILSNASTLKIIIIFRKETIKPEKSQNDISKCYLYNIFSN